MGILVNFPGSNIVRLPEGPDAIWHSGGSLHARYGAHTRDLPIVHALQRREFWARQCSRLHCDPTSPEARLAARRWDEITRALDALDVWNRIVGKPSPYSPEFLRAAAGETDPEPPKDAA